MDNPVGGKRQFGIVWLETTDAVDKLHNQVRAMAKRRHWDETGNSYDEKRLIGMAAVRHKAERRQQAIEQATDEGLADIQSLRTTILL